MTKVQERRDAQERAIAALRETFPRGSTVSTLVTHVSQSGMSRAIVVLHGKADGTVEDLSWQVARALGWKLHPRRNGIRVDGAGMDMAFHLVHTLSETLHSHGYALHKAAL